MIEEKAAETNTKVRTFRVREQFAGDVERLRLPQFVFENRAGEWGGARHSMFVGERDEPDAGIWSMNRFLNFVGG